MRTITLLFSVIALSTAAALARLGENKDEIFKRYGAVQKRIEHGTNEWRGVYQVKDYTVVVLFKNNVSAAEMVKLDSRTFTDAERESLMKAIGGDGKWEETSAPLAFTVKTWTNTTTRALACQETVISGDMLSIATPETARELIADKEQKEKSKTEGF